MHFNIWVNDDLMKDLTGIMEMEGKKRNTVISEAITQYIEHKRSSHWPDEIKNFSGIKGLKNWEGFEADRLKLKRPKENIFEGSR
jgi:hypothetical protein